MAFTLRETLMEMSLLKLKIALKFSFLFQIFSVLKDSNPFLSQFNWF